MTLKRAHMCDVWHYGTHMHFWQTLLPMLLVGKYGPNKFRASFFDGVKDKFSWGMTWHNDATKQEQQQHPYAPIKGINCFLSFSCTLPAASPGLFIIMVETKVLPITKKPTSAHHSGENERTIQKTSVQQLIRTNRVFVCGSRFYTLKMQFVARRCVCLCVCVHIELQNDVLASIRENLNVYFKMSRSCVRVSVLTSQRIERIFHLCKANGNAVIYFKTW